MGTDLIDPEKSYRLPEAAVLAGISYRQIDYWRRTGLLGPELAVEVGSGTRFYIEGTDVLRLKRIGRLVRLGLDLRLAARAVDEAVPSLRGLEYRHPDGVVIVLPHEG